MKGALPCCRTLKHCFRKRLADDATHRDFQKSLSPERFLLCPFCCCQILLEFVDPLGDGHGVHLFDDVSVSWSFIHSFVFLCASPDQ